MVDARLLSKDRDSAGASGVLGNKKALGWEGVVIDKDPSLADRFIFGIAPIDYDPVVLRKPFRLHLAVDALPSEATVEMAPGPPWLYPAFAFVPG